MRVGACRALWWCGHPFVALTRAVPSGQRPAETRPREVRVRSCTSQAVPGRRVKAGRRRRPTRGHRCFPGSPDSDVVHSARTSVPQFTFPPPLSLRPSLSGLAPHRRGTRARRSGSDCCGLLAFGLGPNSPLPFACLAPVLLLRAWPTLDFLGLQ